MQITQSCPPSIEQLVSHLENGNRLQLIRNLTDCTSEPEYIRIRVLLRRQGLFLYIKKYGNNFINCSMSKEELIESLANDLNEGFVIS